MLFVVLFLLIQNHHYDEKNQNRYVVLLIHAFPSNFLQEILVNTHQRKHEPFLYNDHFTIRF